MSSDFLADRRNALEASFFARVDQQLLEELKERVALEDLHKRMELASGISDGDLIDRLIALGIMPATLAAVSLVPLVEVAWADGKISEAERDAILQAARDRGVSDEAKLLLEHWLDEAPSEDLASAWRDYIQGVGEAMTAEDFASLQGEIIGLVERVADAAGGHLGIGDRISADERAKIADLASAFNRA